MTAKSPVSILAPAPERVQEIASSLSVGAPDWVPAATNRRVWEEFAQAEPAALKRILELAEKYAVEPRPILTDADFLASRDAYTATPRTPDTTQYQLNAEQRRLRVTVLTLAEAIENQGRFLNAINDEIALICTERVWIAPGHDWNRVIFEGTRIDVDLISAMTAWTLGTAVAILGEGVRSEVKRALVDKIRLTVTGPFVGAIRGHREPEWWARNRDNWNAVVHGGIVGTALLLDDYSIEERAEMVAAAEMGLKVYLQGFPEDGYAQEGIGYWRYGFGHYVLLAESVLAATKGKVSLYASERAREMAVFPQRFELAPPAGFYPPFSDARYPEPPAQWLNYILTTRYGSADNPEPIRVPEGDFAMGFFSTFLHAWGVLLGFEAGRVPAWKSAMTQPPAGGIRDSFEISQVFIARMPKSKAGLNIAIKAGNNGTSHNHNDLGTFIACVEGVALIDDPGVTAYGPEIFGPNRFQNPVIGSYGHPVPLVAGAWQGTGAKYSTSVLEHVCTETEDRLKLDLTGAYDVALLRKLTRTFVYNRTGGGSLEVIDRVEFSMPEKFGGALTTLGQATAKDANTWLFTKGNRSLTVSIDTGEIPFTAISEVLTAEARAGKVCRVGINLERPVLEATIRMLIRPI